MMSVFVSENELGCIHGCVTSCRLRHVGSRFTRPCLYDQLQIAVDLDGSATNH